MGSSAGDYYAVLGVSPGCDVKTLRDAYLTLAKRYHPDAQFSQADGAAAATPADLEWREEAFKAVNAAYEVLSDPVKRREYDDTYAYTPRSRARWNPAGAAAAARRGAGGRDAYVRPDARPDEPVFDFREWNSAHFGARPHEQAAATAQRMRDAAASGFAHVSGRDPTASHGRASGYASRQAAREQYDVWTRAGGGSADERRMYREWARAYAAARTRTRVWPFVLLGATVYLMTRKVNEDDG